MNAFVLVQAALSSGIPALASWNPMVDQVLTAVPVSYLVYFSASYMRIEPWG